MRRNKERIDMNKNITLVIMAAGMGSRFGGLKQIEPMGPNEEFMIDYSVFDAIKAGFNKIVFIIKEENYQIFKQTIGKRVEPYIKTEYVFQTNKILPKSYQKLLEKREKPLGTGHAILCAKDKVKGPFAVINADDFYGRDAYLKAAEYLRNIKADHYGIVAYRLGNTLTPNGAAKRGVCEVTESNELIKLTESNVILKGEEIEASPLDGSKSFTTSQDTIASMNFLLFSDSLFDILEEKMSKFLEDNKEDLTKCEFLIPDVLNEYTEEKRGIVDVVETNATWYGVTYKEDKEMVTNAISKMTKERIYSNPLWGEDDIFKTKDKTLLIMAAGMGSRFGGLKQIEAMGPHGEFIIDYSIYDAKRAGFNKVVFVIKEENYEIFKETIGKRIESHIKTEYVFQDDSIVPNKYKILLKERDKPLGTGYAILCAKDKIKEPFAVINADDFYGQDAYQQASTILDKLKEKKPYEYAMIGYLLKNTMTENGAVKRGICKIKDDKLVNIIECSVEKIGSQIIATPLNGGNSFKVTDDAVVSMNLSLFTPSFFSYLEENFIKFLEIHKNSLKTCEFFMPDALFSSIKENYATVKVVKTEGVWYGVTYKEDVPNVKKALKKLTAQGEYPQNLWESKR